MRSGAACSPDLRLLLLIAALAMTGPSTAARAADDGKLTVGALLQRMATSRGVEARFREQKHLALLSAPLEGRGVLYFAPPDRMARFQTEPAFSALLVEGDAVRFREAEGEEVDLSASPVARVFVDHFIVLWSGDRERLERLYDIQLSGEAEAWTLQLTPRSAPLDRHLEGIRLSGDASGLREMVVRDADGDSTATVFEQVRFDRVFAPEEIERLFEAGLPLEGSAVAK